MEVLDSSATALVSISKARQQHQRYVETLQTYVDRLIRLPALEEFPDSVFVEDTVVAIGSTACLTRQGAPSRQGEGDAIKDALESIGIRNMFDMNESTSDAMCDGGDIMFTGRHLFVGLSHRTNLEGAMLLQDAFQELDTPIISVSLKKQPNTYNQVLHLKSVVTHLDESTLLAPDGVFGDLILDAMQAARRGYQTIRLPDTRLCNAVVVNGHILAQETACHISRERIMKAAQERNLGVTFLDTSELAKKDGALTCCSVLLSIL